MSKPSLRIAKNEETNKRVTDRAALGFSEAGRQDGDNPEAYRATGKARDIRRALHRMMGEEGPHAAAVREGFGVLAGAIGRESAERFCYYVWELGTEAIFEVADPRREG